MSTTNNLVNIPTQTQTGPNKKLNKCIKFYKEDVAPSSSNEDADSEINLNKAVDRDEPYGKVVQQETKECIDKKRNHMLQDDYYSSTIHQEKIINMAKLPEYITLTENELNARIEEIFEELLKLPNSFVNTIVENLNNYKLSDMFGSVGPMCSCKSLNFLMNANTNAIEKSFEELEKDIAATRFILNDGDSFYRSFMFALIEHQILSQNLLDFKKLIYGVATKTRSLIFKRKNTEINMNEVLYILYLIYMDISKGNIINAYGIFITAVNQSRSFDYGLIKYMKVALSEYITTNADLIFKNEHFEEIEKIAAPAYLNNHSFNYKEYIENRILTMHYDADKFIVQLSPAVFNVNLDLYAVEGTAQQAQHITYLKNYFHCLSDQNTRFSIALFYHFSRYDKLYSKEFLRLYEDKITYIKRDYHQEKRFTIVNANITCENCKVQSDEISFVHIPNYTFCKNCVIEALDKVITKRIAYITNENYNNTGYYCRPVSLGKTFEFTLSDEDFISLINRNIPQHLLYTMDCLCFSCMKPLENNFVKMECGCKFCQNCLIQNILLATNDKIILNEFEKKTLKLRKIKCPCGKPFNLQEAITLQYKEDIPKYTKEAFQRLKATSEITCGVCLKVHEKINQSKAANMNTDTRRDDPVILFDVNDDTCNFVHLMCKGCLETFREDFGKLIKKGECKEEDVMIPYDCKVCCKRHTVENRKIKNKKNSDNACCLVF